MKVTFVIPTLNEEIGIGPTIEDVNQDAFRAMGLEVGFLIVDGASTDRTREIAESLGAKVLVEDRKGYGRAYKTGLPEADGDILITGDADGTYPFAEAHEFVQRFLEVGDDFHTVDRYANLKEGSMSPKHRLGNFILSATTRMLYRVPVRDSQSGMWIIKKSVLPELHLESLSDGMPLSQEIKIEAFRNPAVQAAEVPGSLAARLGEAKIETWGDGFGNLKMLWRRRFKRSA